MNLRNLLTRDSKLRRNRRVLINVHVSFFAWILEFTVGLLGVLLFFLTPFNSSRPVRMLLLVLYSICVPGAYLINDADLKSDIVENKLYIRFANIVAHNYTNRIVPKDLDKKDP